VEQLQGDARAVALGAKHLAAAAAPEPVGEAPAVHHVADLGRAPAGAGRRGGPLPGQAGHAALGLRQGRVVGPLAAGRGQARQAPLPVLAPRLGGGQGRPRRGEPRRRLQECLQGALGGVETPLGELLQGAAQALQQPAGLGGGQGGLDHLGHEHRLLQQTHALELQHLVLGIGQQPLAAKQLPVLRLQTLEALDHLGQPAGRLGEPPVAADGGLQHLVHRLGHGLQGDLGQQGRHLPLQQVQHLRRPVQVGLADPGQGAAVGLMVTLDGVLGALCSSPRSPWGRGPRSSGFAWPGRPLRTTGSRSLPKPGPQSEAWGRRLTPTGSAVAHPPLQPAPHANEYRRVAPGDGPRSCCRANLSSWPTRTSSAGARSSA
jgi:hypothetical protein